MLRFWRQIRREHDPDDEDWAIQELRRPAYGPWLLLSLVVLIGAFTTHRSWKGKQQLLSQLEKAGRHEADLKDLRTRFAALETEKAAWLAEREGLQKASLAQKNATAALKPVEERLLGELREEIAKGDVVLNRAQGRLKINLVDAALFDSGGVRISQRGKRTLARVGTLLANAPGHHLEISGHTDDSRVAAKLRRQFPTNWELSVGRAVAVLRFLQEEAKISGRSLVASGHGQEQPVSDNKTAAGRARNRRIEILLTPLAGMKPDETPPVVQARRAPASKKPRAASARAAVRM